MKYITLSVATVLLLSGCQSLLNQNQPNNHETNLEAEALIDVASAAEINQALLVDEAIDVIHPIADGNVDLGNNDQESYFSDDVWQRIRSNLKLPIPENQRVASQRDWFVKHPTYLTRVAKRAEPFLFYIVEALEENDIPIEIALLPIVESAFDPFAYSHGRASGMWQFVPGTGKRFGMKQNWWYDGRRDVVASTQGAIAYLKYLNKFFDGDWMLALAAYNSGEGRVRRAVRKNQKKNLPTDFWSLDLPKETRAYVPKLLALADIVKRSDELKIKLHEIDNSSVITKVDIGSQLDLAKAAQLAELSLTELQRLNPGFNRWATDPDGPHYLLLPNHKIEKFEQGLAKLGKKERLAWQRYKIKNGDSLGKIAQKFNTEIDLIRQVNNVKGNQIRAGKYLLIPVATASLDSYLLSQNQRLAKTQNKVLAGEKRIHIVKSGDTLWDLSRTYNVSTRSIAKWNAMAPRDTIKPGQKLVIWQKTAVKEVSTTNLTPSEKAIIRNIHYRVRKGDSFARIADKFNVKIKDIERWNSLNRNKYLQPGQMLKLSVDVTNNI
ncbi:LysM peptidoglycan-binding domain-containing protein [Colwellia sp. 6M3]|jgi:membrane-bound lytic murein transglycosylase D|uniref:lytic transglycosylase n=1 Tax=Colwellia sp. 6M3 TaxID=2759849 RepID=UPI0015F4A672|nr:LysM peptidoglycan-binding domain-containing protein [Colwellia sp. 6M3]MBA6415241.1 LysM peptidoglycan-binding domain-containing protein [Colwellia sp. 6M3]